MVKYDLFTKQGQFKDIRNTIYTKLNIEKWVEEQLIYILPSSWPRMYKAIH